MLNKSLLASLVAGLALVSTDVQAQGLGKMKGPQASLQFEDDCNNADTVGAIRRKTVTAMDVVYALKRQGRTLYGFGG